MRNPYIRLLSTPTPTTNSTRLTVTVYPYKFLQSESKCQTKNAKIELPCNAIKYWSKAKERRWSGGAVRSLTHSRFLGSFNPFHASRACQANESDKRIRMEWVTGCGSGKPNSLDCRQFLVFLVSQSVLRQSLTSAHKNKKISVFLS